jgi:hypothetical protein
MHDTSPKRPSIRWELRRDKAVCCAAVAMLSALTIVEQHAG